jgi:hypothetical protein
VLLFTAKSLDDAAERFGLDALLAPFRTPLLVVGAGGIEILRVLAQCITQAVQKGAIVLQFDGVHRSAFLGRTVLQ